MGRGSDGRRVARAPAVALLCRLRRRRHWRQPLARNQTTHTPRTALPRPPYRSGAHHTGGARGGRRDGEPTARNRLGAGGSAARPCFLAPPTGRFPQRCAFQRPCGGRRALERRSSLATARTALAPHCDIIQAAHLVIAVSAAALRRTNGRRSGRVVAPQWRRPNPCGRRRDATSHARHGLAVGVDIDVACCGGGGNVVGANHRTGPPPPPAQKRHDTTCARGCPHQAAPRLGRDAVG